MNEIKEILISQFIDDELNTREKIEFVKEVRSSADFADEAVELLEVELEMDGVCDLPVPALPTVKQPKRIPYAGIMSFTALAASLLVVFKVFMMQPVPQTAQIEQMHRFVVHMPDAREVDVAGSFSGWRNIRMQKTGDSGYWQLSMPLKDGEYSYTFIVDGQQMADPTAGMKQKDDFGGENSILKVGDRI